MGPGFESQRDHKLKSKKHQKPSNIRFEGFFILTPTPKLFIFCYPLVSNKGVFFRNILTHQKLWKPLSVLNYLYCFGLVFWTQQRTLRV